MRVGLLAIGTCLALSATAWAQDTPSRWSQLGASASVMLRTMESNDRLNVIHEELFQNELELTGRTWDVCLARKGRIRQGRLCFTRFLIDDGGRISNDDGVGLTRGVTITGSENEGVFRLGPRAWPVAPSVGVRAGFGIVSGEVLFREHVDLIGPHTGRFETVLGPPESQPASNFIGLHVIPLTWWFGGSLGATANLGEHFAVTVDAVGFETLAGVYRGRVQITYWPR